MMITKNLLMEKFFKLILNFKKKKLFQNIRIEDENEDDDQMKISYFFIGSMFFFFFVVVVGFSIIYSTVNLFRINSNRIEKIENLKQTNKFQLFSYVVYTHTEI